MRMFVAMHDKYKKELEAYFDREMNEQDTLKFNETLNAFPALQEYYCKLVKQKQLLQQWWETQKHN